MTFDPLSLIQLAVQWGPSIKSLIDQANSNADLVTKVKGLSTTFASIMENLGATLFPQAQPQLHVAAGVMAAFDPNITKWVQGSLNVLVSPSPNLAVDGLYGPKTKAAVEQFQAKMGLTVDGWAGQITQAAIASFLAKQPVI